MNGINGVLYKVPTGEPVAIPKRHLAVFGVTRDSGKTTFVEAAVDASGLKAIVFRTKRGELGFDNAKPLPLFFDERGLTHWKALEGLIAATLEEKVQREPGVRYAIISVCKNPAPAKSLAEVHQRVKDKLKDPKLKEFIREVFTKLDAYLDEVLPQLNKLRDKFTDRLELPLPGVYVEDLVGFSDELQNLFVASLIRKVYVEFSGVIVVVAEIWKFLPQDRGSPVKWVIEKYVREMGVVEGWLWIDAQDLRGVDKKHLRSFDVRLFGRQPDPHEIDEILKALPLPKQMKPKPEQIMTLKLGHFYAKLKDDVELVYVKPVWLPADVAIKVARGELEPDSEEAQRFKPSQVSEVNDEVYKEKCEQLEKENAALRRTNEKNEKRIKNLENHVEHLAAGDLQKALNEANSNNKELQEKIQQLESKLEPYETLGKALTAILTLPGTPTTPSPASVPSEISVATEQPTMTIQTRTPPLMLDDSSREGKIAIVYAEGRLPAGRWFTTSDVNKAFISHGWNVDPGVNSALDKLCQWGYFEKQMSGRRPDYRVKLDVEEAKKRGLLRILDVNA